MHKRLWKLLTVFLTFTLAACSTPAGAMPSSIPLAADSAGTMITSTPLTTSLPVVTFTDPLLEQMVRGQMGKPEEDITTADAENVTRLNLNIEMDLNVSEVSRIRDISGLENFPNLEFLDLSYHAVSDISPLTELNQLTLLSLAGNPVSDIQSLASLTNLNMLILDNCTAQDYTPLRELADLEYLRLGNSTITDVSALASLTNLKHLYLAGSPVSDYTLLTDIYPNLETNDFSIALTLEELGFALDEGSNTAKFADDYQFDVIINHSMWGASPFEGDADSVRISLLLEDDHVLKVNYYPDSATYVLGIVKDGEALMHYVYDANDSSFAFDTGDRGSSEQIVLEALDVREGEDVLLAPIRIFNERIQNTFSMTADTLYSLPFEPPTLENLGFFPDEANAVYRYEQYEGRDAALEVHRPEWGEKEYDFLFFTSLSDEYRIVATYYYNERKFVVGADDNNMGGADFELFIDTYEHVDGWCSNEGMTVEDYFIGAYNDPGIEDVYLHSIELMEQFVMDTFGMTVEELCTLPVS